jgi:guanylate kinase
LKNFANKLRILNREPGKERLSRAPKNSQPGNVIVISAPSGTGKTTLVSRLLRAVPGLRFSVSHTTRPPRPGERNGREYFFVSRRSFERKAHRGEFVEWAEVYGQLYGTSRQELQRARRANRDVLLDLDVQGHRQVRRCLPDAVSIFLLPPSYEELAKRLRRRHSDAPETIERRLADARREIRRWREYDFVVVNDAIATAGRALKAVVIAAGVRRKAQMGRISGILRTFGG